VPRRCQQLVTNLSMILINNSFKIPDGKSEFVNHRRRDNAMVKRKRTKNNSLQNNLQ
jgi:hypothetical protein